MFKKVLVMLTTMVVMLSLTTFDIGAYTGSNWMGAIDGSKSLTQLSIPGTHDSGARYEPVSGTAKCQNLTIAEQLAAGVRYLDIRCRHIDDTFAIHHGLVFQHIYFDDVLNDCIGFLNSNPSECIIMCIKEEHTPSNNTRSFEQTFDSYVAQNPDKWCLTATIPTLGQARGKIVLLRRFNAVTVPKGIDATSWADNTVFTIDNGFARLKIQDKYVVPDNNAKWTLIQNLYTEAKSQNFDRLYINFSSGYKMLYGILPSITTVSNFMNPKLVTYFASNTSGRYGITAMDFVDTGKCSLIINTNFN